MRFVSGCVKATVALAALACAAPAAAQTLQFGVKGGMVMTTVSNVSEVSDTPDGQAGRRFGPTVGGFVNIGLGSSLLSLQPEALLTWKGATLDPDDSDEVLRMRYLEVPLLVKLTAPAGGDGKALYLLAGPTIGFPVSVRATVDGDAADIKDRVASNEFGLTVGGGLQGRRWLLEGRYTEGLSSIAADTSGDATRTRAIGVLFGVRF